MPLITCPDCKKEISDAAPVCPHCGRPNSGPHAVTVQSVEKKVSILLGIGIFLMPYIFSWFTLQKGYSQRAKTISFVWLAVLVLFYAVGNSNKPSTAEVKSNSTEKAAQSEKSKPESKAATAATNAAKEKRFEECKAKLVKAQNLEMLYDMDWKPPKQPKVVAGPTFFQVPIDAKEGFAETVNCFLMAGDNSYINFEVLDWRTGKAVGKWSYGKLKMY